MHFVVRYAFKRGGAVQGARRAHNPKVAGSIPAPATRVEEVVPNGKPILWHSNAPWVGTGYGQQSALFAPRIQSQLGYRVAFSAFFGLKGSRIGWPSPNGQSMVVYPGGRDIHGNDVLGAHARHWFQGEPGMVMLLTDPWVLDARIGQKLPLISWVPIDHDPLIPKTQVWLKQSGAIPIAMSRFGERVLREAGHKNVQYVPHGFDPQVYKPLDRIESRRVLGIREDAFVVGMVAANQGVPSRKCFGQAFKAFSRFQQHAPEALLYLHTKLESEIGENLPALCESLELRVHAADQYGLTLGMPAPVVATTLNAFDVLLNPSSGEGFGVPLLEAQACGTPCITTNFSAMPEVAPVSAGNWSVDGDPIFTPFESWQVMPSVDELVAALIEAYEEGESARLERRTRVWNHAQDYLVDDITTEHWVLALQNAELLFAFRKQFLVKSS